MIYEYITKHIRWSLKTFGAGQRTNGNINHIQKELEEIRANPTSLEEWCDIIILGIDGAWRAGHTPSDIVKMLREKQRKNLSRKWPKPTSQDVAVEHIRGSDEASL